MDRPACRDGHLHQRRARVRRSDAVRPCGPRRGADPACGHRLRRSRHGTVHCVASRVHSQRQRRRRGEKPREGQLRIHVHQARREFRL